MTLLTYHPEMNETKPQADGEARLTYYGKHYYISTRLEFKGRGIKLLKTLTTINLVPQARHEVYEYRITKRAFDKLCKTYDFSYEILLD